MKPWSQALALCLILAVAGAAPAAPPVPLHDPPVSKEPPMAQQPSELIVHAGTLLDGKGGAPQRDVDLRIKDGKVVEVGHGLAAAAGVPTVDLGAYTITPGYIDCHTPLTLLVEKGWELHAVKMTPADEAIRGVASAKATLEAGFTTVRNVGASGFSDVSLKHAIDAGTVPGPRMVCAAEAISILGGHGDANNFAPGIAEDEQSSEERRVG